MSTQNSGGIPALRGFRKQFLHTLNRILSSEKGYFYPESLEDFTVRNKDGKIIEIVQVKDLKEPLAHSRLKDFLERADGYIKEYPNVQITLASYGELGPELKQCIAGDAQILKRKREKINKEVFQRLKYSPLTEEEECGSIKEYLTQFPLTTGDWQAAFDLLMQELYRGAEQKKSYTRETLQERLQKIGKYLKRSESIQREWGISIIPLLREEIENTEAKVLQKSFHEGVSVHWRHILSGFDIKRQQHLAAIDERFKKEKIVVVHGASGQGKSALCYRYLYDYLHPSSCYEIHDLSNAKRALEVASALADYEVPLTFYVDASHNDAGLSEFLQRISHLKNVNCLVSIREEDWRRTGITIAEIQFADVELIFDREEARLLYAAWQEEKGSRFPDFEQAWVKFSGKGPLLEFVYLLTHTENLRNRLENQYEQIAEAVECGKRSQKDLDLIRRVAVAGASGARINLAKLSGDATLKQSIKRLEKEYLLRFSDDTRYVTGLHPLRSEILASIIEDPVVYPWEKLVSECLPVLEDEDFEIFLLYTFHLHPEATHSILSYLNTEKYNSWIAINGVLRSLLWLGIQEYINTNIDLIKKVYDRFGHGWFAVLDFVDFVGVLEKPLGIMELLPEEGQKEIKQWGKEQSDKSHVFFRIDNWLQQTLFPSIPDYNQEKDWNDFGQVAYWIGFRKIDRRIDEFIDWNALHQTVEELPIDTLAVLIYGLWQALSKTNTFIQWYEDIRPTLLDRYRRETYTPYIEEHNGVIKAHFIASLSDKERKNNDKEPFHKLAMRHVNLLAQLIPDCTGYGCQGYGHQVLDIEYPYDETSKNISARKLKPEWVLHVNKIARILANHKFRPATWKEYSEQIFLIRKDAILCLDELRKKLVKHFRSKEVVQELSKFSDTNEWKEAYLQIVKRPSFPLEALDRFGYTEEIYTDESQENKNIDNEQKESTISAYLQRYQSYLQEKNKYLNGIKNFLNLSGSVMLANAFLGKAETQRRIEIKQQLENLNFKISRAFLSAFNLSECIKILPRFQSSFRKHFSNLIDNKELEQLEQRERNTLHSLWPLWFCFEKTPNRRIITSQKKTLDQLERCKDILRKRIAKALKKASTESIKLNILGSTVEFDSKPALWITIDGENPLEVYAQTEKIYQIIRNSLGDIRFFSIEHFALSFQWQNIILVPMCKRKLIEDSAWIISTNKFINELGRDQGLSFFNFIPQRIESEMLEILGLNL